MKIADCVKVLLISFIASWTSPVVWGMVDCGWGAIKTAGYELPASTVDWMTWPLCAFAFYKIVLFTIFLKNKSSLRHILLVAFVAESLAQFIITSVMVCIEYKYFGERDPFLIPDIPGILKGLWSSPGLYVSAIYMGTLTTFVSTYYIHRKC